MYSTLDSTWRRQKEFHLYLMLGRGQARRLAMPARLGCHFPYENCLRSPTFTPNLLGFDLLIHAARWPMPKILVDAVDSSGNVLRI